MTRLFEGGKSLEVLLEGILPVAVKWNQLWHPVERIILGWQLDINWWKERIYRNYYKILTTTGFLIVIYHDLLTDMWSLQRIYD